MAGRFEGGAQPGAPAGFDPGAPLRDPAAALDQRDHVMREKLVKVAEARVRSRSPPPSLTPPRRGRGAHPAAGPGCRPRPARVGGERGVPPPLRTDPALLRACVAVLARARVARADGSPRPRPPPQPRARSFCVTSSRSATGRRA